MAGGFPSRVKVASSENVCVSQVDAVPKTKERPIIGPLTVGLYGLRIGGDSQGTRFTTSAFDG
jgi:hypothetical protein